MSWSPSTTFTSKLPPTSSAQQQQQQEKQQQHQPLQQQSQAQAQRRSKRAREGGVRIHHHQQQQQQQTKNHKLRCQHTKIMTSSHTPPHHHQHHQPSSSSSSLYAPSAAAACWTAEAVASLPPPGMSGPSQITFSPNLPAHQQQQQQQQQQQKGARNTKKRRYLAFVTSPSAVIRTAKNPPALYRPLTSGGGGDRADGGGSSVGRGSGSSRSHHHRHHSASSASSSASSTRSLNHAVGSSNSSAMATSAMGVGGGERMLMYLDLTEAAALLEEMDPEYFLDNDSFHSAHSGNSSGNNNNNNKLPPVLSPSTSRSKPTHSSLTPAAGTSSSSLTSSVPIVVSGTGGHTCCSRVISPPTPLLNLTRNNNNSNGSTSRQRILDNNANPSKSTASSTTTTTTAAATTSPSGQLSLEERLRRERQRLTASPGALTQFSWAWSSLPFSQSNNNDINSSSSSSTNNTTNNASSPELQEYQHEQRQEPPSPGQTEQRDAAAANNADIQHEPHQEPPPAPSLRILIPARGSLYMQEGVMPPPSSASSTASTSTTTTPKDTVASFFFSTLTASSQASQSTSTTTKVASSTMTSRRENNNTPTDTPLVRCIHDKIHNGACPAVDPQLSPDGSMVAWTFDGEVFVQSTLFHQSSTPSMAPSRALSPPPPCRGAAVATTTAAAATVPSSSPPPIQVTFGAQQGNTCISHGIAEFVAQEEMDRYRGFWWNPDSTGIILTRVDETPVPPFRIVHHGSSSSNTSAATDHPEAGGSSSDVATTATSSSGSSSGQPLDSSTTAAAASGLGITYEEHRYPFAGKENPKVQLLYVTIDRDSILNQQFSTTTPTVAEAETAVNPNSAAAPTAPTGIQHFSQVNSTMSRDDDEDDEDVDVDLMDMCPPRRHYNNQHHDDHHLQDDQHHQQCCSKAQRIAMENWNACTWFDSPREASEYLARVHWLPDGSAAIAQWQNRAQTVTVLTRMDIRNTIIINNNSNDGTSSNNNTTKNRTGKSRTLLIERSEVWINLHHMFKVLPRPIHPDECVAGSSNGQEQQQQQPHQRMLPPAHALPEGSFSFIFASERSGYSHLYLYTYVPGINGEQAMLMRTISAGDWMVESIVGVDLDKDVVYLTGTYDSVLERHLYALPITNRRLRPLIKAASVTSATLTNASPEGSRPGHPKHLHHQNSSSSGGSATNVGPSMLSSPAEEAAAAAVGSLPSPPPIAISPNGVRRGLSKVIHALSGKSSSGKSSANHTSSNSNNPRQTEAIWSSRRPIRLTVESGMHNIVMDEDCQFFVDTSSDMDRPMSVRIYALPENILGTAPASNNNNPTNIPQRLTLRLVYTLYDALLEDKSVTNALYGNNPVGKSESARALNGSRLLLTFFRAPELMSFPTSDGSETLHAAVYRPDPSIHGPGPYPLICAVYGGPHVQRVNRSWSQCSDMRAQRLRSLGFCVVKCDNRGSSRRGLAFESAIARRLGRLEVLDQVAVVRQLTVRGVVDPTRVGVYGWSYGGYLAAMCLARAPDIFACAVAGAPVTNWDGYDTHYTERYMGLPSDNIAGYRESAVLDHVPNIRGKLLLVHGLIDENVHFRHTARLINKLVASGKDYELLIFPEERHSPRRLRDRIYMEQRISDFFVRQLQQHHHHGGALLSSPSSANAVAAHRTMPGHL